MSRWANVATLGKAKNLKGGLLAYARKGLPFLLEEGTRVVFVPPVLRAPREGCVTSVQPQGRGAYLVYFDSVTSIDISEQLQDHVCLVKKDQLQEGYDEVLPDLEGMQVIDMSGKTIGTIVSIEDNPAHPLLVVKLASETVDADHAHIRIPLVEEFITNIDHVSGTIEMDLPDGLLDLGH